MLKASNGDESPVRKPMPSAPSGYQGSGTAASTGEAAPAERTAAVAVASALLSQLFDADIPVRLVERLGHLDFEVRKDVISIFSALVRLNPQLCADPLLKEYAMAHPKFFELIVEGHADPEVATHCGMMLRSCARHRGLTEAFLTRPKVALRLLALTKHASFDVSSDAFSSLHDLLLTHKSVSVTFLEANIQDFFKQYNGLLQTKDYVTQRQALKLLSEMLLDRTFMRVMLAYIGDEQFLQIHMNLLRADSKAIQFEAFHVFKIFVANPQKPPRVQQILYQNREKLVKLLESLKVGRSDDRQFAEDRGAVIEKLLALEPALSVPKAAVAAAAAPAESAPAEAPAEASAAATVAAAPAAEE